MKGKEKESARQVGYDYDGLVLFFKNHDQLYDQCLFSKFFERSHEGCFAWGEIQGQGYNIKSRPI